MPPIEVCGRIPVLLLGSALTTVVVMQQLDCVQWRLVHTHKESLTQREVARAGPGQEHAS